uniref:Uncharacterized protein n=1 Tax=Biomphalaria glabrata TaxID=6526 RepID=A0A2C9KZR2_BIOGL
MRFPNKADIQVLLLRWPKDLWLVLDKPVILFSMIVLGFFLSMFALLQTRWIFYLFGFYQTSDKQLVKLLLLFSFLWIDLVVLRSALSVFKIKPKPIVKAVETKEGGSASQNDVRKNPPRKCKKK